MTKISGLSTLSAIADQDEYVLVDKDDTGQAPTGSTKKSAHSTIHNKIFGDITPLTIAILSAIDVTNLSTGHPFVCSLS